MHVPHECSRNARVSKPTEFATQQGWAQGQMGLEHDDVAKIRKLEAKEHQPRRSCGVKCKRGGGKTKQRGGDKSTIAATTSQPLHEHTSNNSNNNNNNNNNSSSSSKSWRTNKGNDGVSSAVGNAPAQNAQLGMIMKVRNVLAVSGFLAGHPLGGVVDRDTRDGVRRPWHHHFAVQRVKVGKVH